MASDTRCGEDFFRDLRAKGQNSRHAVFDVGVYCKCEQLEMKLDKYVNRASQY